MARALTLWLTPPYAADLRFEPDLDKIEALAPERDALWKRLEATSFLTDDEKRAAAGYDAKTEGGDSAAGPFARKYREDQARDDHLDYWRNQPTDTIIESLKPGEKEALRTYPDGTVVNGNTRAKVLQERGFDINSLPREQVAPPTNLPPLKTPRGGGSGGGGPGTMPFRRPPRI